MRYRRFRIQMKALGPVEGYSAKALDWAMPATGVDAEDYHHATVEAARLRCLRPSYGLIRLWAWVRILDSHTGAVMSEWKHGRRVRREKDEAR